MAITQTGSTLTLPITDSANTGTVSSTITVPADTVIVTVGVSGFQGTNSGLEAMTFTKGGADTAMTKITGGDASSATWQGAAFWQATPDTGTNKSLKWDWIGAGASAQSSFLFSVTFWTGCDTSVRDSDGAQASAVPIVTPTLTASSGDKIVAFGSGFTGGAEGTVDTWTNLTELTELVHLGDADGAWATADPSGNQTAGFSAATNLTEVSILAVVLIPAAVGGGDPIPVHRAGRGAGW